MNDVEHPSHYNREGAMECIDEMILLFGKYETGVFCKLNAWKYRYRAGQKSTENGLKDLAKSDWYMNKYKELKEDTSVVKAAHTGTFSTQPEYAIQAVPCSHTD